MRNLFVLVWVFFLRWEHGNVQCPYLKIYSYHVQPYSDHVLPMPRCSVTYVSSCMLIVFCQCPSLQWSVRSWPLIVFPSTAHCVNIKHPSVCVNQWYSFITCPMWYTHFTTQQPFPLILALKQNRIVKEIWVSPSIKGFYQLEAYTTTPPTSTVLKALH